MSLFNKIVEASVPHWINGAAVFIPEEDVFDNHCSFNGEVINKVASGGAAAVAQAVEAGTVGLAKSGWGRRSFKERAQSLLKLAALIERNTDDLARLESLDTGKPLSETATGDIPRAAANLRFFAELAASHEDEVFEGPGATRHVVSREPIGVVGLVTPWNLPLYLETWKVAPALLCGNAVVLKPAELTPLTAYALALLSKEAGIPDGILNVVQGFGAAAAGEYLVSHPDIGAVSFTGETTTGQAIAAATASQLKRLSFELGGKGASIVCADADIAEAAATIKRAAFRNQGQICLAGSRLIVHEKVKDQLLTCLREEVSTIRLGDPLDKQTTMGSLISMDHRNKVAGFVDHARQQGFEVLCGGAAPESLPHGAYYQPTIIDGVTQESRLIQEEIFGPVLTVQSFSDDDEALELVNGTKYGLSCSVWSRDAARLERLTRGVRMGLVWQNSWFLRNLHTAFGGMKSSGLGREGGRHSLDFYAEYKTVSTPI